MQGKNPTRKQKMLLKSLKLNYENWLILKNNDNGMLIEHRISGQKRLIPKSLIRE